MKVVLKFHTGEDKVYANADRVVENDKYRLYIYNAENHVLAVVDKGDLKSLLTEDDEAELPQR